jgi:hypothetical protein
MDTTLFVRRFLVWLSALSQGSSQQRDGCSAQESTTVVQQQRSMVRREGFHVRQQHTGPLCG